MREEKRRNEIDNPILKAIFIVGITGYIHSGVT